MKRRAKLGAFRIAAVVGTAGVVALGLAPVSSFAATAHKRIPTTDLSIAITASPTALPIWVGEQEGFFAKNHLAVTTTLSTNINLLPPALESNQYQIAVSTAPTLLNAIQGGLPVTAIAGDSVNTRKLPQSVQLMVAKGSPITSVSQLAGATIGSPSVGGNVDDATEYWLKSSGVNLSTIHTVAVNQSTMAGLLESGQVTAVEASQPALGTLLAAGAVSLGDPWLKIGQVPNLSAVLIADTAWANANKQAVTDFYTTLAESNAWIAKHEPAAYGIAASETSVATATEELSALPSFQITVQPIDFNVWIKVMCSVSTCPTVTGKAAISKELLAYDKTAANS
jgi:NitT/TauT family transport system substrate-binding protein